MRIFVTGGTGLVGGVLVKRLLERGEQVTALTRRPEVGKQLWGDSCTVVGGDPMEPGPWQDAVKECDAVVHLAGENLFGRRWNAAFKDLLRNSRVQSTQNIVKALQAAERARVLVNASAIGYYGATGDEVLTEDSPAGHDFLAQLCVAWETAADAATALGRRAVRLRVGVVLAQHGGALQKMLTPFKMFVGGPVGSGRQYMSWIHIEDLVGLILFALERGDASGPLNGTAPNPVTNREFSKALGRALHRPACMKTPRFMLRVMLGEVANVIATGQRVVPRKALDLGYRFRFPELDTALRDLFPAS